MGIAELMKRETGMVAGVADPEVSSKAIRRRFTATYKRRMLQEADQCCSGGIAELLRREGLYSSHLTTWRKQRESEEIAGLEPRKRGKKPVPRNSQATSKNRASSLDLDLDLDVDADGLVRGKLFRHNIYQIAPYICMPTSKSTSRSRSKSRTGD